MEMTAESRPLGIYLVCLLIGAQVVAGLTAVPGLLLWGPALAGVIVLVALAQLAAAVGILRRRNWGWALGVVAVPLGVLGPVTAGISLVLAAALALVVVGYLVARRSLFS